MKRMTKKLAMIALTSLLVLAAGCSGNNSSSNTGNNGGASSPTPTAENNTNAGNDQESSEPVTIKLHTFGNEATYNWAATIAAFEDAHPNISVDLVVLSEKGDSQEALQKLDLEAGSGATMDVLMFSDAASYAQRVGLGMVAPLDEYIAAEGFNLTDEYKVDTTLNGQIYALPGKFNPWYVLLNKTMLDDAGLEVPTDWTWDDFAEYARKLTKGEGNDKVYGTYFHGPQNGGWMEFMKLALANQPGDSEFLKEDGTSNIESPLFKRTLELRYQFEQEGISTPYQEMLSQKLHYRNQFFNQDAAMVMIGSWMNTELGGTEQFPLNFEVAVAPIPKNNDADEIGYTMVTTDYVAVAASSKHKEEAYQFVRWYTTDGQIAQGKNVPSWKGVADAELANIIDIILSGTVSPEKVDKQSLINTLANSKSSKIIPPVSYQSEVYKVINEEYEKLIFGQQDIDTTVQETHQRVTQVVNDNQ